ncbi:hypothetical protein DPMN_000759 [Dreissena polymorpha]|uniref:Uncharacterized protein n=1 Tax=Dreissena polymorpha TaxID=45954 RepID=A0A9D4MFZ9_DREPO|nr:hypothetical protein DPMN_000759 [Dreissena polymorpha]
MQPLMDPDRACSMPTLTMVQCKWYCRNASNLNAELSFIALTFDPAMLVPVKSLRGGWNLRSSNEQTLRLLHLS